MRHKVKVTVIDKKLYPEFQQEFCMVPDSGKCPCYNVGDDFMFYRDDERDDYWHMGAGTIIKEGTPDEGCLQSPGIMYEMKKAGIGGNYVPGDNLHLTLAFIGESGKVADIKAAIKAVKFKPHITLIRKATNAKLSGITLPNIQMEVREISLMKSENKGGRMVYTRI